MTTVQIAQRSPDSSSVASLHGALPTTSTYTTSGISIAKFHIVDWHTLELSVCLTLSGLGILSMPVTTDEDAALAAIASLNEPSKEQQESQAQILSILHEDESNPFVDIHELFKLYDVLYFRSLLLPRVEVSWSPRLTLCAGMCELVKDDKGKYRRIRLKMSEPLLKYRPRSDTINTLLHEAIHAYFFVTTSWKHSRGDDGTGHGAGFLLLADAISTHGGYEITVFHTFHDEVDSYRTHVWKCDGPCQQSAPYFGLVKRSMNRPPSKSDPWWSKHEAECGGIYAKISEPDPTKSQLNAMSAKERAGRQKNKIDAWVQKSASTGSVEVSSSKASDATSAEVIDLRSRSPSPRASLSAEVIKRSNGLKRQLSAEEISSQPDSKKPLVACPICDARLEDSGINQHLDIIHYL